MSDLPARVLIVILGLILGAFILWRYQTEMAGYLEQFREEQRDHASMVAASVEDTFAEVYAGLRTIARLPDVRVVDRHGEKLGRNARQAIQEIYENLAERVDVSELYLVPLDFDPDALDPRTKRLQEPIATFDARIVGRHAGEIHPGGSTLEEVEIFEYRLMTRQLAWLREHHPTEQGIAGLNYPAVGGEEVITCDNSLYNPRAPNDADRSGLVYAVPFYGPGGELRGTVTAILLTRVLLRQLPEGRYGLVNPDYGYTALPREPGPAREAVPLVQRGRPDPRLDFCAVRPLSINDGESRWLLWAGSPREAFASLHHVIELKRFTLTALLGALTLCAALWYAATLSAGRRRLVEEKNRQLARQLEQMEVARSRLRAAQRLARLGSWQWDRRGQAVIFDRELCRVLGIAGAGERPLDQQRLLGAVHPEDLSRVAALLAAALREDLPFDTEHRIVTPEGLVRVVHHQAEVGGAEAGTLIGTVQDVTERRHAEDQLRLAAQVFQSTAESIMITDAQARILEVNPAFTAMTGYSREEAIGKTPAMLRSHLHDQNFYTRMWQELRLKGEWTGEIWNRHKNGSIYPRWQTINAVRDSQGEITHYFALAADISRIKAAEDRLHQLAHYDSLTGVPNRALFRDRLEQALQQASRNGALAALLFLDLDRFKNINDSLGHRAGDELLIQAAARLKKRLRQTDCMARLGGDEFTLLLTNLTAAESAGVVAREVNEALEKPFQIGDQEVFISASIGISIYPHTGRDAETLFKTADIAMYVAKEQGGNTFQFYSEQINRLSRERIGLENDLRRARERHELRLVFQPQIDLATGRPCGLEALVRWRHAERGEVPPGEFIPLAEEAGLIEQIDDWVLQQVCRQIECWHQEGLYLEGLKMAVNFSARQFAREDLPERIAATLEEAGVAPGLLELEITEGTMIRNIEHTAQMLERLKAMGLSVAIDDFGTGYSSLSYLQRLPIDKLKIDRSFLCGPAIDKDREAIISAIIVMAHTLGRRVLAEGVETPEAMALLRRCGCDQMQGFLYARPLESGQLKTFFSKLDRYPVKTGPDPVSGDSVPPDSRGWTNDV